LGNSIAQGTFKEDYVNPIKDNFNKYVYNPISDLFKDEMIDPTSYNKTDYSGYTGNTKGRSEDITIYGAIPGDYSPPKTSGITKDYTSTSTGPAFDYSPKNINPSTGQTMTPQTDTIPGDYSPPSVNISVYDTPNPYMEDLQAAFDEFNTEFETKQEAKRQDASAAAAYGGSTWSNGDSNGSWGSASITGGAGSGDNGDVSRGSWGGGAPGSGDFGDVSRGTW